MIQAVQVTALPYVHMARGGPNDTIEVTRVVVGDVGVVIDIDGEGDALVIFDHRIEALAWGCLKAVEDPMREQMWKDALFLEVNDQFEAAKAYWRHRRHFLGRIEQSGKVCARCITKKPLDAFGYDSSRSDGYTVYCRACEAERQAGLRQLAAREH